MEALEMPASESGIFLQFKFLVDGQWATSPVEPITGDGKVRLQSGAVAVHQ